MFSRIRNQLTLLYAGIMLLLILTLVTIGFTGLTWAMVYELKQEVSLIANEEVDEQLAIYTHTGKLMEKTEYEGNELIHGSSGRIFCYVLDHNGTLVVAEEPIAVLRDAVLEQVQETAIDGNVSIHRLEIPDDELAIFMMTAKPIYYETQLIGTVYLGKDVTEYYYVLKKLLIVLIGGTLVVLLIASGAGHYISGRAMIPIRQSFARQREFAADASHALRTPLSVLLASVDVIQTDEDSKMSGFSQQVLTDMKDEIHKMSNIVSDLLTLARSDAGVLKVLKERLDIRLVAQQIIRPLQTLAAEKKIMLELEGSSDLIIFADRERISQLLLILIDNAIKYTPPQGKVSVKLEAVNDYGPKLKITVQDTGIGIAAEHQALIFERFYRVDKIRSREAGGTGLGLAIAWWIVEAHGGVIEVKSEVEKGSIFTVLLPMQ